MIIVLVNGGTVPRWLGKINRRWWGFTLHLFCSAPISQNSMSIDKARQGTQKLRKYANLIQEENVLPRIGNFLLSKRHLSLSIQAKPGVLEKQLGIWPLFCMFEEFKELYLTHSRILVKYIAAIHFTVGQPPIWFHHPLLIVLVIFGGNNWQYFHFAYLTGSTQTTITW